MLTNDKRSLSEQLKELLEKFEELKNAGARSIQLQKELDQVHAAKAHAASTSTR